MLFNEWIRGQIFTDHLVITTVLIATYIHSPVLMHSDEFFSKKELKFTEQILVLSGKTNFHTKTFHSIFK